MANFAVNTKAISTMEKIIVQNADISIVRYNDEDYISLTDMASSQLQESQAENRGTKVAWLVGEA